MLIIISPTKTMQEVRQPELSLPTSLEETKAIMKELQSHSIQDLMQLMKIRENLATINYHRFQEFRFDDSGSMAIQAYQGLQYKYMKMDTWTNEDFAYANNHIRILSGLYGILKPMDSIYPYRLEMQCNIQINNRKNLYEYWKQNVEKHVIAACKQQEQPFIINLTSKEYSKVLSENCKDTMISIVFKVEKNGALRVEATQAKMARGKMVAYVVKHRIDSLAELKEFKEDGFYFMESLSSACEYVFVKKS